MLRHNTIRFITLSLLFCLCTVVSVVAAPLVFFLQIVWPSWFRDSKWIAWAKKEAVRHLGESIGHFIIDLVTLDLSMLYGLSLIMTGPMIPVTILVVFWPLIKLTGSWRPRVC